MARDFAKKRGTGKRRSAARRGNPGGAGGWRLFAGGLVTGVFLSFMVYLGTLPRPDVPDAGPAPPAQPPETPAPKPRFDFYTLLPEQTIEVEVPPSEVEPARDLGSPGAAASTERYLLQAGSFRQREDADRRRAELLLLGLEPTVQEASGDNGRWFRVYLGPFASRAEVSRARGLTAAQDIDTLLLKRGTP